MTYFDTAYILKCYVKDTGWQQVRAFAQSCAALACSVYGRLELHAALHRTVRERRLTAPRMATVLRQFDLDEARGMWTWLPLTPAIMAAVTRAFRSLPADVYLRTGDAIHLLTAKASGLTEIYSNDTRLLQAATALELTGRNVIG